MNIFITDLLKLITPENFAMVVAIFLLVKVTKSLDRLSNAVENNCADLSKVFSKLDDILIYLEYGIIREGLFSRGKSSRISDNREGHNDKDATKEHVLPAI